MSSLWASSFRRSTLSASPQVHNHLIQLRHASPRSDIYQFAWQFVDFSTEETVSLCMACAQRMENNAGEEVY